MGNNTVKLTQEADYGDHKCMQLLPKFGKHDERKDVYLEKKLREVALAWHEEKQVGSILRHVIHVQEKSST